MINFSLAFIIYLIIFAVLLYMFSAFGMGLFSALTLTALISALILIIMIPPSEIDRALDGYFKSRPRYKADDWVVALYLIIVLATLALVSAYVIFKAFEDRNRRMRVLGDDFLCDFNTYLKFW